MRVLAVRSVSSILAVLVRSFEVSLEHEIRSNQLVWNLYSEHLFGRHFV